MNDSASTPSRTCFIVSPIGDAASVERRDADLFKNGIVRPALELFPEFQQPVRADEVASPGMITDDIIVRIFDSDLVIADITGLNPNVFYELGIRHAAAKATIHCATVGTVIPFDNKGYSTIFYDPRDWNSIETTRLRIQESIKGIFVTGFRVTNPVTHALSTQALLASADPKEKIIAELSERLSRLEGVNDFQRVRAAGEQQSRDRKIGDILLEAMTEEGSRRAELRKIAVNLAKYNNTNLSDFTINRFAKQNSGSEDYNNIMSMIEDKRISDVWNLIDDDIPF